MQRTNQLDMFFGEAEKQRLRKLIHDNLREMGFVIENDGIRPPSYDKETLRRLNEKAVSLKRQQFAKRLKDKEDDLLSHIANGDEVEHSKIEPVIIPVYRATEEADLFHYITLFWSVPVAEGVGRRVKYLVKDKYNGKVIGIIGLADPIFHQRTRDDWVGWTLVQKKQRLYHVLDGHILGAVPPYNRLICGKLIAMLATSDDIREDFVKRYAGKRTIKLQRSVPTTIALITTLSALGKSSVYNRLKYKDRFVFQSIGYSVGYGSFHFENIYDEILEFLKKECERRNPSKKFDPSWFSKMELVTRALHYLGLPRDYTRHNIQREVFVAPLARNTREFLRGETDELDYYADTSAQEYFDFFRERWLLPRAARDPSFREFQKESLRIWRDEVSTQGTLFP